MLDFVELLSHLGDPPSESILHIFVKYRVAFRRIHSIFDGVLPSAESVLMSGIRLKEYTGKNWVVDGSSIQYQVRVIAEAASLDEVLKLGIDPAHYKKLREIDARAFLGLVAEVRSHIIDPIKDLEPGGALAQTLLRFLDFSGKYRSYPS